MNKAQLINQDSGKVEYYTPSWIVEAARLVMGSIDLDPASNAKANETVKAKIFIPKDTIENSSKKTEEEPLNKTGFIFEHRGKKIVTEFKLSEDQELALKGLIEYVLTGTEPAVTLEGEAGTGKTTIIRYLEDFLKSYGYSFVYMAPTHAATVELGYSVVKSKNNFFIEINTQNKFLFILINIYYFSYKNY